jgi:TPR repeat protein
MKKLITICFILATMVSLKAQQLRGTQEFTTFGGSRYTIVNWSVNYQIILKEDSFYIRLSDPKISAAPSSLYGNANGGGKLYSKAELGLSVWPDSDPTPYNMEITLNLQYPDGTIKKQGAVVRDDNYIVNITKYNNLNNASASSFKVVSVEALYYNGGNDGKLDRLIATKNNGKTNSSSANTQTAGVNSSAQTGNANQQNGTGNLNNNTYGNSGSSNTGSTSNKTIEALGEFSNAVGPMLEQWGNNIRKRREAEYKRAQEKAAILSQKNMQSGEAYFQRKLDQYLKSAENGDENARMLLVANTARVSIWYSYDVTYKLPNMDRWIIDAAKNKNSFAMDFIGNIEVEIRSSNKILGINIPERRFGYDYKQALLLLEESANLGSLDAMLTLANYYDKDGKYYGSNKEKAFYWFSEAAKKGSPTAMYNLGKIYRYKKTNSFFSGKYKIKTDDSIAFSWFLKSAAFREYNESMFGEYGIGYGSKFEMESYKELAIMYEKGLGCTKDLEVAKKLQQEYDNWRW